MKYDSAQIWRSKPLKKMLESRPEDALGSLVETVDTVETDKSEETVLTVETVGTEETGDCGDFYRPKI